eukprot:13573305-Alexandrium_andersonii.AAC.1
MRHGERLRGIKAAIPVPVEEGKDAHEEPGALRREVHIGVRIQALLRLPLRRECGKHQIGGAEGGGFLR